MQIRFSQLKDHLRRLSISVLLVSGNEPYQHMLAADMFRGRAKELDFTERKILTVETGFDWSELEFAKNNLSLFAERTLIDLRIPTGKPGSSGSKAIVEFVNDLPKDLMLLVQVPRLDRNTMNSAWAKAMDKTGVVLRVWPLNDAETKKWIRQKLELKGFTVTNSIVTSIAQQAEGNLLAAMQEIEKISLMSNTKKLDVQEINAVLTNSSHYSLNELIDAVESKNFSRVTHILYALKKEGIAPPLLLWGLSEKIRKLAETSCGPKRNQAHSQLAQLSLIHQRNIGICRDGKGAKFSDLLKQCAWTDRVIKGRANGNPWHELLQLSLAAQLTL